MEEARLEVVPVGGGTGGDHSRDVTCLTSGPLGERAMVPGGRERTQQEDELQHQVEDDSAQGPVVRARGLHRHPAWTNGTVIWKQDMPNTEVGVRSVWLAKERARLIDGWKRRATMGIQSFVWTMPFWFDGSRGWLLTHPVPCKGTQH